MHGHRFQQSVYILKVENTLHLISEFFGANQSEEKLLSG